MTDSENQWLDDLFKLIEEEDPVVEDEWSEFETNFVKDLQQRREDADEEDRDYNLSEKQSDKLYEIWKRRCA